MLCDYYTGIKMPGKSTDGDETVEYEKEIEVNGQKYMISYSEKVSWISDDEWSHEEAEVGYINTYKKRTNITEYDIRVPEEYDGIVMYAAPVTKESFENADFDDVNDTVKKVGENEDGSFDDVSDVHFIRIAEYAE